MPTHLRTAYSTNGPYQRAVLPPHTTADPLPLTPSTTPLTFHPWPAAAKPYLGNETYYPDFLRFFQSEIGQRGSWQAVVARYLFSPEDGDELLVRLYAGLLHPLIQLMYGVEFGLGGVVAEGLAQAAVHSGEIGGFLLEAERVARENTATATAGKGERVMELLEAVRRDETVAGAARNGDANKVRDGVLTRAKGEMVALAARVRVRPEEVEEKTAEMFDAAVFVAAAAALVKEGVKEPEFDFFLM